MSTFKRIYKRRKMFEKVWEGLWSEKIRLRGDKASMLLSGCFLLWTSSMLKNKHFFSCVLFFFQFYSLLIYMCRYEYYFVGWEFSFQRERANFKLEEVKQVGEDSHSFYSVFFFFSFFYSLKLLILSRYLDQLGVSFFWNTKSICFRLTSSSLS